MAGRALDILRLLDGTGFEGCEDGVSDQAGGVSDQADGVSDRVVSDPVVSGIVRKRFRELQKRSKRKNSERVALKQIKAQGLYQRLVGNTRTADHVVRVDRTGSEGLRPGVLRRRVRGVIPDAPCRGPGKWRRHTPEAMIRSAFADLNSSFRKKASEGSSGSHALHCTWSIAGIVGDAAMQFVDEFQGPMARSAGPLAAVDDFQINNNMFDETQLWLKTSRFSTKKRRRVLAVASQVT